MFRKILASIATLAIGVGLAVAAAGPAAATPPINTNDPSVWVAVSGEVCVKHDFTDPKPTTQTYADLVSLFGLSGKTVTKVIIKAGSSNGFPQANGSVEFENEAFYTDAAYKISIASTTWTQVANLTAKTFSHYSNKTISHVIVCYTTPSVEPTPVSGDATVAAQTCDTEDYTLVPGSITPVAKTGVVYELWNSDKTVRLIENFAANSGPLANGTYFVKVLPADGTYTVSEANMWLERTVGAYVGTCAPTSVTGDASVAAQTCDTEDYTLVPGSITPIAKTGVVYELWNSDKTVRLIENFAANSGPLANGTYFVKVLPADGNYTVSEANMWLERTVGAFPGRCIGEVKVAGDPFDFQECVPNEGDGLTSSWVATLTIVSSPNVQYRVYFSNGLGWDEQGVWPAGVYTAGPTGDFPYGTEIKVVAQPVGNYILTADPNEWLFEFPEPFACDPPTLGTVTPVVTFSATCSANPTYTLSIEGGVQGTVLWRVNGGAETTQLGTFAAPASTVTVVASPAPPAGFDGNGEPRTFSKTFGDTATCGDLTTLALTGGDLTGPLWIAGFLGLLGTALVRSGRFARAA